MSGKYEHIKVWRRETKGRLVRAMGGKCVICGLEDDPIVYDFHHRDATDKDFQLSGNIKSWGKLVEEAKKCVLLCVICHRKYHAGMAALPSVLPEFDETLYKRNEVVYDLCSCGKEKHTARKSCSLVCAAKKRERIDWELAIRRYHDCGSYRQVAQEFGVSDVAVKKQVQKRFVGTWCSGSTSGSDPLSSSSTLDVSAIDAWVPPKS